MFNKFKFLALGAIGFVPIVMFSCGVGQKVETKDDEKPLVSQATSNKEVELKQNNTTSKAQRTTEKNQSSNVKITQTNTNQKKPRLSREEALKKLRETKLPQLLPPTVYDKQLAKEKEKKDKQIYDKYIKVNGKSILNPEYLKAIGLS